VEQGFYNTRTEFIRTAIKQEIDKNSFTFDKIEKESTQANGLYLGIGVVSISRKELEKHLKQGTKMKIFVIGVCRFSRDVDVELVEKTVESFRAYGIRSAPPGVIEYLDTLKYLP
jgi:hypothetical protein